MVRVSGVDITSVVDTLTAGVIVARGCSVQVASAGLDDEIAAAIETAKSREETASVTGAVRDLLRHGKYKPTGRGKPASEYLLKAALQDRFPAINNLVDINNLVSLSTLLPISLVDLTRAESDGFVLRRGHVDESYVFNAGGQQIGLTDLLLVARTTDDLACANPVKDSMQTKLQDDTTDVMAVLYAPNALASLLEAATLSFAEKLSAYGGSPTVEHAVLAPHAVE